MRDRTPYLRPDFFMNAEAPNGCWKTVIDLTQIVNHGLVGYLTNFRFLNIQ
jgi:hypothetical protein